MFENIFIGIISGIIATFPMTLAMFVLFFFLPRAEQYDPAPKEITENITKKLSVRKYFSEGELTVVSVIAHFAFGGSMGALYGLTLSNIPGLLLLKGFLFGVLVWATSYLFALPFMNILSSALKHPLRRTLLMIGAHLVWGYALAYSFHLIS